MVPPKVEKPLTVRVEETLVLLLPTIWLEAVAPGATDRPANQWAEAAQIKLAAAGGRAQHDRTCWRQCGRRSDRQNTALDRRCATDKVVAKKGQRSAARLRKRNDAVAVLDSACERAARIGQTDGQDRIAGDTRGNCARSA